VLAETSQRQKLHYLTTWVII